MYSLLYVRTAERSSGPPVSDLTGRARLRNAAIECFAEQGFDATVRAIATRAGVSPALITHHFGTKKALREECDAEVLRQYQALKLRSVAAPSAYVMENMPAAQWPASLLVYLLRAILAGGPAARTFLDRLIDDMRPVMAEGLANGQIRPSQDEEARLRFLAYQSMGALVVQFVTARAGTTPVEFADSILSDGHGLALPMLELYCEGLMTDRQMLDDYLAASRRKQ